MHPCAPKLCLTLALACACSRAQESEPNAGANDSWPLGQIAQEAAGPVLGATSGTASDGRDGSPENRSGDDIHWVAPKVAQAPERPQTSPAHTTEAAARTLLQRLLAAQNSQDFAAYEQLYARKFTGIKRVGSKTRRYARTAWIADRKRMFEHPIHVVAEDETVRPTAITAELQFTQHWSSANFADTGTKRMLLVMDGPQLKIAREELLESRVVRSATQAGDSVDDFLFAVADSLALRAVSVPPHHDVPVLLETNDPGGPEVARASIVEAELDEPTRALLGTRFVVDETCEATISGFDLVTRVVPHFGVVQNWDCVNDSNDCQPATADARARDLFAMGQPLVVARLDGCNGGIFARPSTRSPFVLGVPVDDPALAAKAIAAFGRLAMVRRQVPPTPDDGPKRWWAGHERVEIFRHPSSGRTLVSVDAGQVGAGCDEFSPNAWATWESKGGKLVPLAQDSAPVELLGAIDVNGDGQLELLIRDDGFGTERALVDARTLKRWVTLSFDYQDCPC